MGAARPGPAAGLRPGRRRRGEAGHRDRGRDVERDQGRPHPGRDHGRDPALPCGPLPRHEPAGAGQRSFPRHRHPLHDRGRHGDPACPARLPRPPQGQAGRPDPARGRARGDPGQPELHERIPSTVRPGRPGRGDGARVTKMHERIAGPASPGRPDRSHPCAPASTARLAGWALPARDPRGFGRWRTCSWSTRQRPSLDARRALAPWRRLSCARPPPAAGRAPPDRRASRRPGSPRARPARRRGGAAWRRRRSARSRPACPAPRPAPPARA